MPRAAQATRRLSHIQCSLGGDAGGASHYIPAYPVYPGISRILFFVRGHPGGAASLVEAGEGGLRRDQFLRSIEDSRWKLIHVPSEQYQRGMQQMEFELYEVRDDPMETVNIIDNHPDLAELMKALLADRVREAGDAPARPSQQPKYSEEEIENLRSLGYIR